MATKKATAVKKDNEIEMVGLIEESKILHFDPTTIRVVEGRNKRIDMGDLSELMKSIKEKGIQQPGMVQIASDGVPELVDGHRRLASSMMIVEAGGKVIFPAQLLSPNASESAILMTMLTANNQKPFDPIEEAMMLQDLKEKHGFKHEEIAKQLGCSVSHVTNRLALVRSAPELQQAVKDGKIGISDADTIAKKTKGDHDAQRKLVEEVEEAEEKGKGKGAEVVQKKLKTGRLQKHQWEVATDTFDRLFGAIQTIKIELKQANAMDRLKGTNYADMVMKRFEKEPELEFLWYYAQMSTVAEMAGLSVEDMVKRCEERVSGKKAA